ncbi:GtrA family protein [Methylococcus capsulatus]|uniref:GtrA family protein n=1 Tax=Methylococcus capsulatus TaxID=414 RepID=UPI00211B4DB4|nr:GtrA family protein [Methylococcus capsulatus]
MAGSLKIALRYSLFALIATAANIGSQDAAERLYRLFCDPGQLHCFGGLGIHSVTASVWVGTAVGLVVKYVLDKKYIFRFKVKGLGHDSRTFALYTLMGLVTTGVFWGFEFGFDYLFQTRTLRYAGGVIGLALGYWMKYHMDKRFVFRQGASECS